MEDQMQRIAPDEDALGQYLREAVHAPRVYEYVMSLAPRGNEGVYSTLASMPLFAVKLAVGAMSGDLLQTYCPEGNTAQCQTMWLIIGAAACSTPVLLLGLSPYLRVSDANRLAPEPLISLDELRAADISPADEGK